jgi:hypothetical protein
MTNVMHKFIYLFPCLLLLYMFRAFFKLISRGTVYKFGIGSSLLGMVSASGPAEADKEINKETCALRWLLYSYIYD